MPLDGDNDLSVAGRNKSLEATFGNQLTLTQIPADGTLGTITTSSPQFIENGVSVSVSFSETPSSILFNDVPQTVSGATFVTPGFSTDSELKVTFT